MEQSTLSKWLKCVLAGVGVCGLVVYLCVIPLLGNSLCDAYPEFTHCFWPWLIFILATAVPCYTALVFAWKISANIGKDRSFSEENAGLLKWMSNLAAADSAFFFIGNMVMTALNMNHPGIIIASSLIVFMGVAVAVAFAALSHLVKKAAALQEQSDLTI